MDGTTCYTYTKEDIKVVKVNANNSLFEGKERSDMTALRLDGHWEVLETLSPMRRCSRPRLSRRLPDRAGGASVSARGQIR